METRRRATLNARSNEPNEGSRKGNRAYGKQDARKNEKYEHHAAIQNRRFGVVFKARKVGRAEGRGLSRVQQQTVVVAQTFARHAARRERSGIVGIEYDGARQVVFGLAPLVQLQTRLAAPMKSRSQQAPIVGRSANGAVKTDESALEIVAVKRGITRFHVA